MVAKATGSIFKRGGKPVGVRVSMPDGSRPLVSFAKANLPPAVMEQIASMSEAELEVLAQAVSDDHRDRAMVLHGTKETVNEFAKRWLESRDGRVASLRDNRGHLDGHVLPVIGPIEMARLARADIERLVSAIDAKVRAGAIGAKTAQNIWGTLSKMLDDATNSKPAEGLRCLDADPSNGVRGPDDNEPDKLLQFLYPSEFIAFVDCVRVPLALKRTVAIAIYMCMRDGEQRALKWSSVNLKHGIATIEESFDRRAGADREGTKSGGGRVVQVRPELQQLLELMHEESGGKGLVCPEMPNLSYAPSALRYWLLKAGIDRAQLHKSTTVSRQIRWHDLRATGLTWMAVEGRSATEIRDVAGHTQTSMTDRYMRSAALLRSGRFGEVFPHLPGTWHATATVPATSSRSRQEQGGLAEAHGNRTRLGHFRALHRF